MIYVECYPDATLVQALTGLPRREIIHENGKFEVVRRVGKGRNLRGLVDEDPLATQPAYLKGMTEQQDLPERGLRLLEDTVRGNHLVILRPRLEDWLVRAARDAEIDLTRYGLPNDPRELHKVINLRLLNFERLVDDLRNSARLTALRRLLNLSL